MIILDISINMPVINRYDLWDVIHEDLKMSKKNIKKIVDKVCIDELYYCWGNCFFKDMNSIISLFCTDIFENHVKYSCKDTLENLTIISHHIKPDEFKICKEILEKYKNSSKTEVYFSADWICDIKYNGKVLY